MELYFSRHGKTQWNDEMKFQGRDGDSPLLPESYEEIKKLGKRLADIPFKKVYCSPSKRAKATAQGIVAELAHPVEIVYVDELLELGLGSLEGQLITEAKKTYGETLDALRYTPDKYDPAAFGGEPYSEMLDRSVKVVRDAIAEEKEGPLLFVSHGATLTGCIQTLAGKPLAEARSMGGLSNSSLSILRTTGDEGNPTFDLVLWDDCQHLEEA